MIKPRIVLFSGPSQPSFERIYTNTRGKKSLLSLNWLLVLPKYKSLHMYLKLYIIYNPVRKIIACVTFTSARAI